LHTAACARPQHAPTRQIYSTPLSLSLYTFFICNFFLCCRHCCVDEEMSARCSSFFCHSEPAQPASSRAPSLVQGAVVTVRVCVCVCVRASTKQLSDDALFIQGLPLLSRQPFFFFLSLSNHGQLRYLRQKQFMQHSVALPFFFSSTFCLLKYLLECKSGWKLYIRNQSRERERERERERQMCFQ